MPKNQNNKNREFLKKLAGNPNNVIDIPAEEKIQLFLFPGGDSALVIAWELDDNNVGYWRILPIGLKKNAVVKKCLAKNRESVAFFGEAAVVGVENNDLFNSFSYEDEDIVDAEGNVINKIREIKIMPAKHPVKV